MASCVTDRTWAVARARLLEVSWVGPWDARRSVVSVSRIEFTAATSQTRAATVVQLVVGSASQVKVGAMCRRHHRRDARAKSSDDATDRASTPVGTTAWP